jgi:hypothetical protein
MEGATKYRTSVNAFLHPADIAKLDELAQRTGRNRSQMMRILIREAKVREPDILVELAAAEAVGHDAA